MKFVPDELVLVADAAGAYGRCEEAYAVRQLLRPLSAARCAISKYELCRGLQ